MRFAFLPPTRAVIAGTVAVSVGMATPVSAIPTPLRTPPASPTQAAPQAHAGARGDWPTRQRLAWRPCGTDSAPTRQCARLIVPRDYSRPNGPTFSLALARVPASGSADARIGSLVFNPGGPGGSGVEVINRVHSLLDPSVAARFDLVSFDPRGVGDTTPALKGCDQPWATLPTQGDVNWKRVRRESAKQLAKANRACQRRNRGFINNMGTVDVARDVDALRSALGDRKLNYWGASYGTRIGSTYATMYPNRIRVMVLDGDVDPNDTFLGFTAGALGPDKALRMLRKVAPSYYDVIVNTVAALSDSPIQVADGIRFTRWTFLDVAFPLVQRQSKWGEITTLADYVDAARDDTPEGQQARDELAELARKPNMNQGGAFSVVNCLDYPQRPGAKQQNSAIARIASRAPVYGGSLATDYAIGCSGLDLKPRPVPMLKRYRAAVADLRVVVSNATHDVWTPLFWAKRMHAALPSSSVITYRGTEHVIWSLVPSACVNRPINKYVLTTRRPPRLVRCPFAPNP